MENKKNNSDNTFFKYWLLSNVISLIALVFGVIAIVVKLK